MIVDLASTCTPDDAHGRLRLELMSAGRELVAAFQAGGDVTAERERVARVCVTSLLPRLDDDDVCLLEASLHPETRLLAEAMRAQIRALTAITQELGGPIEPWEAVAATRALYTMLSAYTHHHALLSSALSALAP
ncbi:hypothetical protein [Nocardioides sp.]|uniref:hypothetical protein n=1 Tax=Nocardioides sp. TaxID=35761 RepID=UPI002ED86891